MEEKRKDEKTPSDQCCDLDNGQELESSVDVKRESRGRLTLEDQPSSHAPLRYHRQRSSSCHEIDFRPAAPVNGLSTSRSCSFSTDSSFTIFGLTSDHSQGSASQNLSDEKIFYRNFLYYSIIGVYGSRALIFLWYLFSDIAARINLPLVTLYFQIGVLLSFVSLFLSFIVLKVIWHYYKKPLPDSRFRNYYLVQKRGLFIQAGGFLFGLLASTMILTESFSTMLYGKAHFVAPLLFSISAAFSLRAYFFCKYKKEFSYLFAFLCITEMLLGLIYCYGQIDYAGFFSFKESCYWSHYSVFAIIGSMIIMRSLMVPLQKRQFALLDFDWHAHSWLEGDRALRRGRSQIQPARTAPIGAKPHYRFAQSKNLRNRRREVHLRGGEVDDSRSFLANAPKEYSSLR